MGERREVGRIKGLGKKENGKGRTAKEEIKCKNKRREVEKVEHNGGITKREDVITKDGRYSKSLRLLDGVSLWRLRAPCHWAESSASAYATDSGLART